MKLSYDPAQFRRCIGCEYRTQPPLRRIVDERPKFSGEGTFVLLECGHIDGSLDEFRELHPEWWW